MAFIVRTTADNRPTFEVDPVSANWHKIYFTGSTPTYGANIILNADGDNTTDWNVSGTTQLGDYWQRNDAVFNSVSIIDSVNGFTNRAQHMEAANGSNVVNIYSNNSNITNALGKSYKLWFQYRCSHTMEFLQMTAYHTSGFSITSVGANTGSAISTTYEFLSAQTNFFGLWIRINNSGGAVNGDVWIEIDKIMVKEIL